MPPRSGAAIPPDTHLRGAAVHLGGSLVVAAIGLALDHYVNQPIREELARRSVANLQPEVDRRVQALGDQIKQAQEHPEQGQAYVVVTLRFTDQKLPLIDEFGPGGIDVTPLGPQVQDVRIEVHPTAPQQPPDKMGMECGLVTGCLEHTDVTYMVPVNAPTPPDGQPAPTPPDGQPAPTPPDGQPVEAPPQGSNMTGVDGKPTQAPAPGGPEPNYSAWYGPVYVPESQAGTPPQAASSAPKVEPAPAPKTEPAPESKVEPAPAPKTEPAPVSKVEPAPVSKVEPAPVSTSEPNFSREDGQAVHVDFLIPVSNEAGGAARTQTEGGARPSPDQRRPDHPDSAGTAGQGGQGGHGGQDKAPPHGRGDAPPPPDHPEPTGAPPGGGGGGGGGGDVPRFEQGGRNPDRHQLDHADGASTPRRPAAVRADSPPTEQPRP